MTNYLLTYVVRYAITFLARTAVKESYWAIRNDITRQAHLPITPRMVVPTEY
jgi:hypothetical protein